MNDFLLAICATVASWILVGLIRKWSEHYQVLDIPNHRSSHTRPTSRGGGLAIVLTTLVGCLLIKWTSSPAINGTYIPYLCGGLLIAIISLLDDIYSLSNRIRFAAHILAAVAAIWSYGAWQLPALPFLEGPFGTWIGMAVTLLWIVGLTNAYNFMDGIDGIAGGQAVVAGSGWLIVGSITNEPLIQILGLLLASGSLGFLGHNWPPARIFMGDVGSAFLGYSFAVIPLLCLHNTRLEIPSIFLLWPFLFDSIFTFTRRLLRGENVFKAHRSHLYQRLTQVGLSHLYVTSLYVAWAVCSAALAILVVTNPRLTSVLACVALPGMGLALWLFVIFKENQFSKVQRPLTDADQNKSNVVQSSDVGAAANSQAPSCCNSSEHAQSTATECRVQKL